MHASPLDDILDSKLHHENINSGSNKKNLKNNKSAGVVSVKSKMSLFPNP